MTIEWKDINDDRIRGNYKVSSDGQIMNFTTGLIRKSHLREGYRAMSIPIKHNGSTARTKTFNIHRLVAKTFHLNPDNLPVVNHKDLNKENNAAENLEWVSYKRNNEHYLKSAKWKGGNSLKVLKFSRENEFIAEYASIIKAAKMNNCCAKKISAVCRKQRKTHADFIWKYKDKILDPAPKDGFLIKGYKNYLITADGKIYNKTFKQYMKPHINNAGYHSVGLSDNGKKEFYIHQLVAQTFLKNDEGKRFVNHKNCIKSDNSVENLEWVTASENMIHLKKFQAKQNQPKPKNKPKNKQLKLNFKKNPRPRLNLKNKLIK